MSYLLSDDLGSSTIALSSTGSVVAVQLFAPFGSSRYSLGSMPTTYNFTGQRLDSETGLLYYGARYYDPFGARFVQADTVQNNANGMDPYAYVGENPETRTDPTGKYFAPPGGSNNAYPPPRPQSPPPVSSPQATDPCTINNCSVSLNGNTYTTQNLQGSTQNRLTFLKVFYNVFAPSYGTAELSFLNYLQNSGRLDEKGGYWDVVDYGLVKDALLAAFDFLQGHAAQSAVVGDWLGFLNHHSNYGWWAAHNASINAGDQQARAGGLYRRENPVEQAFINETINVLHTIQFASSGNTPLSNIVGPQSPVTGILTSLFYSPRSDPVSTAESLYVEEQTAVYAGAGVGAGIGFIAGPFGAVAGAVAGGTFGGSVFLSWLLPPSE